MAVPQLKLNDGTSIPIVAFGAGSARGQECVTCISGALADGFRSIDCAQEYRNSEFVGEGIRQWGGKREELYITTKFGLSRDATPEEYEPRNALTSELKKLGVEYVDMFLIHDPAYSMGGRSYRELWTTMEALQKEGLTRSIGVSNFLPEHLEELQKVWKTVPAVNQLMYQPYWSHTPENIGAKAFCDQHGILIQGYGPLTPFKYPGGPVESVVRGIAEKHGITPSHVLLSWAAQSGGGTVVTFSRDTQRRRDMLLAFTHPSPLSDAEVQEITRAGRLKTTR